MGWPDTPEGREKKKEDQRRWWHKKNPDARHYTPRGVDTTDQEDKPITEDDKRMQEIANMDEQYTAVADNTETPVLKSELQLAYERVIVVRKQIEQLTEKRDSLRAQDFANAIGEFDKPLDDVERADAQQQENIRVDRLRQKYDTAIAEKEAEVVKLQASAEAMKTRKLELKRIVKALKAGRLEAYLSQLANDRAESERELANHTAILNDSPTHLQKITSNRAKRGAERQIRKQMQQEADLRNLIPQYEAMIQYISGDFQAQQKTQETMEKQREQLEKQLDKAPTGDEPVAPEDMHVYIEFLEPWGGYLEGRYMMVSALSEETSADLVDANIARYIASKLTRNDVEETLARQESTGNYSLV